MALTESSTPPAKPAKAKRAPAPRVKVIKISGTEATNSRAAVAGNIELSSARAAARTSLNAGTGPIFGSTLDPQLGATAAQAPKLPPGGNQSAPTGPENGITPAAGAAEAATGLAAPVEKVAGSRLARAARATINGVRSLGRGAKGLAGSAMHLGLGVGNFFEGERLLGSLENGVTHVLTPEGEKEAVNPGLLPLLTGSHKERTVEGQFRKAYNEIAEERLKKAGAAAPPKTSSIEAGLSDVASLTKKGAGALAQAAKNKALEFYDPNRVQHSRERKYDSDIAFLETGKGDQNNPHEQPGLGDRTPPSFAMLAPAGIVSKIGAAGKAVQGGRLYKAAKTAYKVGGSGTLFFGLMGTNRAIDAARQNIAQGDADTAYRLNNMSRSNSPEIAGTEENKKMLGLKGIPLPTKEEIQVRINRDREGLPPEGTSREDRTKPPPAERNDNNRAGVRPQGSPQTGHRVTPEAENATDADTALQRKRQADERFKRIMLELTREED